MLCSLHSSYYNNYYYFNVMKERASKVKINFWKCLSFSLKGGADNGQRSQLHLYEG